MKKKDGQKDQKKWNRKTKNQGITITLESNVYGDLVEEISGYSSPARKACSIRSIQSNILQVN